MHIAIAGFIHETNTFAPFPTRHTDFGDRTGAGIPLGAELFERAPRQSSTNGFADMARAAGHTLVPVLHAYASPGGYVAADAFECISGTIIDGLRAAANLDAVFLELHGAMVAEHIADADAELLRRIRREVGAHIPIVAALDSHANVGQEMVSLADALVSYRTYPHVDMRETGERAYRLMEPLLHGASAYKRAFKALPFLMPIHLQNTSVEPCRSLYLALDNLERSRPSLSSLSFTTGFPLADVPQCSPAVFAYGDCGDDVDGAVEQLVREVLERESGFTPKLANASEAVQQALSLAKDGTVVLADVQDNAGGGGTSDTVWIIDALVNARVPDAIVGLIVDPDAADASHEAGEGSIISIGLGGKLMPGHRPIHADFHVERVAEGPFTLRGPMLNGTRVDLGKMAQLRIGGVRIVVASRRIQCLDRAYFRAVGLNPEEHEIVVVKSSNHYRADFSPIASHIIEFAAPGACAMDPSQLSYQRLQPGTRLFGCGPAFY